MRTLLGIVQQLVVIILGVGESDPATTPSQAGAFPASHGATGESAMVVSWLLLRYCDRLVVTE